MSKPGVVLFAHGARDPKWSEPFESLAARFAALEPDVPLSLAYLDFMTPDLPGAVRALIARGCDAITIVPAFLGVGGAIDFAFGPNFHGAGAVLCGKGNDSYTDFYGAFTFSLGAEFIL